MDSKKILNSKSQMDFNQILNSQNNINSEMINELLVVYKNAKNDINTGQTFHKKYKIILFVTLFCALIGLILIIIGAVTKITPIWAIGIPFAAVVVIERIFALTIKISNSSKYPAETYLNIQKFLLKYKTTFDNNPESLPISIKILYYPDEAKKLPVTSSLREIPKINANLARSGNETETIRYLKQWANKRTISEFCNFVIQFHDYCILNHKFTDSI